LEFQSLVLKGADETFEERDRLFRVGRCLYGEAMLSVGLKFRRLVSKRLLDAFLELQFGSSPGAFQIRKSVASQVLDLRNEALQTFDSLSNVFQHRGLRPRALCFYSCHDAWKKCSEGRSF